MTAIATIEEIASEAYGWFETATRPDGESFIRTKEGAPEWVGELVRDAHGDFLPDDWRYTFIRNALSHLSDGGDPDDSAGFAGEQVDVYTSNLIDWLGSNLRRVGYVDQAAEDYGHGSAGLITMIGWGQYMEAEEVFASVSVALQDRASEQD